MIALINTCLITHLIRHERYYGASNLMVSLLLPLRSKQYEDEAVGIIAKSSSIMALSITHLI